VSVPVGERQIRFLTRRGHNAYANLEDVLEAIKAMRVACIEAGWDPYPLDVVRDALLNAYAKAR
jgi:hypothetical protein